MSKGFIPIKRSLFGHFLFKERRVFSRFEAWLDLIQLASFTDGQTDLIKGKLIIRNRGEVIASVRWLCNRWTWSIHKVIDFIELLRSQDMVIVDKENGIQKLRLVNFEKHNSIGNEEGNTETKTSTALHQNQGTQIDTGKKGNGNSKRNAKGNTKNGNRTALHQNQGTQTDTVKGTAREQSGNSQGTNYNKENNINNLKKEDSGAGAPSPTSDEKLNEKQNQMAGRQKDFYSQLIPFVSQYSKKMIRAFYDYWSEPNKSKTKMKYELEPTWDLSRRLSTWEDNDIRWNKTDPLGANRVRNDVKPADKTFTETINYLFARFREGELDERLVLPEYYDKLVVYGAIPVGSMDQQPGDTIDEKKRYGVLQYFKHQAHVGSNKETV